MGNCVSRTRGKMLPCSRKKLIEDEPMLSSTYDSEAPHDQQHKNNYQGPCRYPSELVIDRSSEGETTTPHDCSKSHSSSIDRLDTNSTLGNRSQRSQSRSPALQQRKSSTPSSSTPKSGKFKFSWKGYRSLRSGSGRSKTDLSNAKPTPDDESDSHRLVDAGCQTVIHGETIQKMASLTPEPTAVGLTKEYIVRTYSIQNATPSPTTNPKFSPSNPIVSSSNLQPLSSSTPCSSKAANKDLSAASPNSPPPIMEETIISETCGNHLLSSAPRKPNGEARSEAASQGNVSSSTSQGMSHSSQAIPDGPLSTLEQRQLDVIEKLEKLKGSVEQLAVKYNVSTSPPAASSSPSSSSSTSAAGQAVCTPKNLGNCVQDIVISADPSSIPLSLIILGHSLDRQYSVFKSTFVHSSVADEIPQSLRNLMTSNGGRTRLNSQLAISLIWKKVSNGPQLVVDPTKQTPIQGEANVARYLARLLQPAYDETGDIMAATQIDDFLDLAQLQIVEGNTKEKAAGVRSLNSALGKKDWLVGDSPSIADFVCWSALHQTGQASAPPSNVKKWLTTCSNHDAFSTALSLVNVLS